MTFTIYGDGSLYGDADAYYGRLSPALYDAQSAQIRSTGLKVTILDEHLNDWSIVNGVGEISTVTEYKPHARLAGDNNPKEVDYWAYRGQADVIQLGNGNIVRARVGALGDYNDRKIYIQEITDPAVDSQWQSWTLLYSGTHYGVALVQTSASTYDVYHTKSGVGFCKNNSPLVATASDGTDLGSAYHIQAVETENGRLDDYFILIVPRAYDYDLGRVLDFYICDGATAIPSDDNFKWYRNSVVMIEDPNDANEWFYFRSFPMHQDPRTVQNGEAITVSKKPAYETDAPDNPPKLIRGLAGRAGYNTISLSSVRLASDGYFYLFYGEFHADEDWQAIQNTPFVFWQRSKDGLHWSEPVLIGHTLDGFAGGFESGGYFYLAGNGAVIRRPMTVEEFSIENYVPRVEFELPRDNQEASGTVVVANPSGVNDDILELSDRRIKIEPGIKVVDGTYQFQQLADLWIKKVKGTDSADANRIQLQLGDVWTRLSQQLRDTFNIIGRTEWDDWKDGEPNEMFDYYFQEGNDPEVVGTSLHLPEGGLVLWTGWKGHNPDFSLNFDVTAVTLYARYVDESNYMKFYYNGTNILISVVRDGVASTITNQSIGSGSKLRIVLRWNRIDVYKDDVYQFTTSPTSDEDLWIQPGYVGFGSTTDINFSNFHFVDWEDAVYTSDLVKFALAMGDYHDVIVGGPDNPQYALIWGPQTDLPTAADGLRQVLTAEKLELIWKDGVIQVGQFKDLTPVRTFEDEVINSSFSDEANKRVNLAIVDGNEDSWFEADEEDARTRGRQIIGYYDLPELMTQSAVKERAQEEVRRGKKGQSPAGNLPLFFDIRRMDALTWIDNLGRSYDTRVEGIRVEIDQGSKPRQNMQLDQSLR